MAFFGGIFEIPLFLLFIVLQAYAERDCVMDKQTFKVKYISNKKSIYFKKGFIYNAFLPKDNPSGNIYASFIEDAEEPGEYALPANRFEIL